MSKIDDQIRATSFIGNSPLSFEQVREKASAAAASASGVLTKVVETEVVAGELIQYSVKRAGAITVGNFGVVYSADSKGSSNTVMFVPGNYITSQASMLFIPVGPKDSAAYQPFRKFSETLRASL